MKNGTRILAVTAGLALAVWSESFAGAAEGVGPEGAPDSVKARAGQAPPPAPPSAPLRAPLHDGVLNTVDGSEFETVFVPTGLQVYIYTPEGAPAMVEGAAGKALIRIAGRASVEIPLVMEVPAGKEPAIYFCPMHPEVVQAAPGICPKCGGMKLYTQNRLVGRIDLKRVAPGSVTADVTLQGVTGRESDARFVVSNTAAGPNPPDARGARTRPAEVKPRSTRK